MLAILFLPQIYETYKSKNVDGLSTKFLLFNIITSILWNIYGVGFFLEQDYINASILLASNTSIFISVIILLCMKKVYTK